MNIQLIGSAVGAMLAAAALLPNPEPLTQVPAPQPAQTVGFASRGNLVISTVPGNVWVQVKDYTYTPRIPPDLDLAGWDASFPVRAVVRDAQNTCVGRITNESGQLQFIFVEADPPMCGGATPGQRGRWQVVGDTYRFLESEARLRASDYDELEGRYQTLSDKWDSHYRTEKTRELLTGAVWNPRALAEMLLSHAKNAARARQRAQEYQAKTETEQAKAIATIPIIGRLGGIPIVNVTIDGYGCEMLFDTGCSAISITAEMAQKLRPKKIGSAFINTAGGTHDSALYELASVRAGDMEVYNVEAVRLRHGERGLLGQGFIGGRVVTIRENTIEIERTEAEMTNPLKNSRLNRKLKGSRPSATRPTVPIALPKRDDFVTKQDALHSATAKAASWMHLAASAVLGALQTFFKRTFLSVVAGVTLVGGMSLSALGYAVSAGFIPDELMGNGNVRDTLSALVSWSSTAPSWELLGAGGMALLALVVQAYQSWSLYTIQNARSAGKTGGKPIFSSLIHRLLFWAVTALVWYLDFQAIAGVSFAAGIAGIALWLWAAFPSEIAAMILQIQRSAKDE